LHNIYTPVQGWAEEKALMVQATQLLALIVCHSPYPFWQAHMDVSKEGKQNRNNPLLGEKGQPLLRHLLTDQAYEDKSSRAALCGILRLLTGGHQLPESITGKPADGEWWHESMAELGSSDSLMNYKMRSFMADGATRDGPSDSLGWSERKNSRPSISNFLGIGQGGEIDATTERLRFILEKLFARKTSGRHVRLPKLIENGDVLVYIVSQIAAHSPREGDEAIKLLLRDPKDLEHNLVGVFALGRILK
jgi:hypothetical protein